MPTASVKTYFIELNDHSLVVAKASSAGSPAAIETIDELRTDNKAALGEALGNLFPETKSGSARVVCALRAQRRFFHLATPEEGKKSPHIAALKTLVSQPPFAEYGAVNFAAVLAEGGALLDGKGARWLLAGAPQEAVGASVALLRELKLEPVRVESATLSLLAACQAAVALARDTGPVLIWEVGEKTSDLFMVGAEGVQSARRVAFGFDAVVDAIATEINLKFKASAAKLFFNDLYDFSESGPKVGARMAAQLQAEVSALALQAGKQPVQFVCAGFPARQQWFSDAVAKGLSLVAWQPDVAALGGKLGVKFAAGEVFSPSWHGLLSLAGAFRADKPEHDAAWHPVLHRFGPAPVEEKVAPAPVPAPVPAAPSKPAAAPAPAPAAAKPAAPAAPAPSKKDEKPAAPAVKPAAPAPAAKAAPAPAPSAPKKEEKPAPPAAKPAAPAPAKKDEKPAAAAPAAAKKPFFLSPAGIGIGVAALAIGAGLFFYISSENAKAEKLRQEQEARARADAEALRAMQQKAEAEAEARRRAEQEAQAAAEDARRKADDELRRMQAETQRLLNARGSLRIVTTPSGATVSIDNLTPRETPATFGDMRLGVYTAEISMAGYEPTKVEVEVKENQTTDPGVVRLVRQTGSLELVSEPTGVAYEVRPSAERFGSNVRQGVTPETLEGLPTGEYVVTLTREDWPVHTETILIERNRATRVTRNFEGAAVNVTSVPQGATVKWNGNTVGVTPMTIKNVPVGGVTLQLELAEYHPKSVSGTVQANLPLDLVAKMQPLERIARMSELDEQPLPVKTIKPVLTDAGRFRDKFAMISAVIDKDGSTRELKVEKTNDEEYAALCLKALAQWKFSPGLIRGEPVRARVTVPFSER